jgi:hypothetical protein
MRQRSCDNTLQMYSKGLQEAPRGEEITCVRRAESGSCSRHYLDRLGFINATSLTEGLRLNTCFVRPWYSNSLPRESYMPAYYSPSVHEQLSDQ